MGERFCYAEHFVERETWFNQFCSYIHPWKYPLNYLLFFSEYSLFSLNLLRLKLYPFRSIQSYFCLFKLQLIWSSTNKKQTDKVNFKCLWGSVPSNLRWLDCICGIHLIRTISLSYPIPFPFCIRLIEVYFYSMIVTFSFNDFQWEKKQQHIINRTFTFVRSLHSHRKRVFLRTPHSKICCIIPVTYFAISQHRAHANIFHCKNRTAAL